MLTLKDFGKVLVSYYKRPNKWVAKIEYPGLSNFAEARLGLIKGAKKGVLVATGPGIIGWSLCSNKEPHFKKDIGLAIALSRAITVSKLTLFEREDFYSKVPFTLQYEFDAMMERSFSYFQVPDSE